jgi:RNA polymerase sigma-70 factor (ECF subfamily)
MLTEDAVLTMPPWVYWLNGRDAVVATMLSPGTWEGEPRPGRYRIVPCGMNGQPAGLAYVRFGDGPYVAVCMTIMTLAPDGRISRMDTFVLPEQFTAWGLLATLEPAAEVAIDDLDDHATPRVL